MKLIILCFTYLFSAIFSSIIASHESSSSSSLPSDSFLGIPPQDEDYFKGEIIKCKNGSKKFTQTQLNDDFCDCPDGTDEPGTSACPQGKFYCINAGYSPSFLFSSRVNDGICDSCDGSDEYDGKVKCPNTCWEAGKIARDKLQEKIKMYNEGVALRKHEIDQAKRAMARDKAELLGLKNEKEVLEKVVKQLQEQIQKLEQKERLEKEDSNKKVENEKSEPEVKFDGKKQPLKLTDAENMELSGESSSYLNEKGEHESTEELSKEELGRLVASRWTGKKSGDQAEEIDPAKNGHVLNRDKEESAHNEHLNGIESQSDQSWLVKIQETAQKLLQSVNLFSIPVANLDANQVRKEYENYTSKLSDIESRISSLTEKFKYDFGKENEFYLFYDRCFESKQDKYVYKVCPFKDATQEEGSSKTRLGIWEKFGNSYRMMLFSNGDGCWNGPDRSLKVKLRCGLKTELTGVDEPSRCEYATLMYTRVLCLEEKLKELTQKLESMNREQPWSRDEL